MLRGAISALDRLLFDGALRRWVLARRAARLEQDASHRFTVAYQSVAPNLLTRLCDKYGSDKGSAKLEGHVYPQPPHTYADFYSRLFSHCRMAVKRVFECGVGTHNVQVPSNMGRGGSPGASLRVWREYFPNAEIVGADIDRSILFREERIATFFVDQTSPQAVATMWNEIGGGAFDLMIDDGLHEFEAGRCLFESSIHNLASDGIYAIEDVKLRDMRRYQEYFRCTELQVDYVFLYRPRLPMEDNCLVVVRRRESGP